MPGTILGAVAIQRIAQCHIKSAKLTNSREGLVEIYKAARFALVRGELFDSVCHALTERAKELEVYREGSKKNA